MKNSTAVAEGLDDHSVRELLGRVKMEWTFSSDLRGNLGRNLNSPTKLLVLPEIQSSPTAQCCQHLPGQPRWLQQGRSRQLSRTFHAQIANLTAAPWEQTMQMSRGKQSPRKTERSEELPRGIAGHWEEAHPSSCPWPYMGWC